MKSLLEILKALYSIRDAIKGKNGNEEEGGDNEKSLDYFELTDKPIGVISSNFASPKDYNEEELIKIEDFVEQLGVPKREQSTYLFVYDKDISNTVNFNKIYLYDAEIANGDKISIELAQNRFCFLNEISSLEI